MTEKNKIIIFLSVFGILAIFLIFFLIFPTFKEIENYSKEIILKKQEILFLEEKAKNIEKFKKTYINIKDELKKIENLFVNLEIPIDFIKFLEENSQGLVSKISLTGISKEEKGWSYISFIIETKGDFPSFLKFFEKTSINQLRHKSRNEFSRKRA